MDRTRPNALYLLDDFVHPCAWCCLSRIENACPDAPHILAEIERSVDRAISPCKLSRPGSPVLLRLLWRRAGRWRLRICMLSDQEGRDQL